MTVRLEADGWSARLDDLAALSRVDALAIVLPAQGSPTTYAVYNLPPTNWSATPAAATIVNAMSQRAPGQLGGASLTLADGRTADSLAATPITWRDQLVGALVALATRELGPDDLDNLARAADIVAIDLAESNVSWRAQRHAQELEGRARIVRELRRTQHSGDLEGLLERAIQLITEQFGADGVSIMFVNESNELRVRSSRGLPEDALRATVPVGSGISGGVARSGQPTLLVGPVAGGSDESATESMIVPLRVGERMLGVLSVKHRGPDKRYSQAQLDSLALIGQDIASMFTSADELMRAENDRQQAIVLYELSRFSTLGTDPANDLLTASAMLSGTLNNDCVAIWQLVGDTLRLRAAAGYEAEAGTEFRPDEADTTLATVLREKKSARQLLGTGEPRPFWAQDECTSYLLSPVGGQGVLVLSRKTEHYTDPEVEFTATVAEYLVGMLQKSQAQDVVDRGVSSERRRIAQEIHDGLAQELTGVVLALEGCQRAYQKDPTLLAPQLQKASRDARATLADVRQYMAALRQSETGALNLPVTLGRLVDDLRRQTGLTVEMDETGAQRELEPIVERALIRIVGEALRNVAQHAGANKAKVALLYGPEGVVVTIEDDGKGFDVETTFGSAEGRGHFGVVGMRERAEAAGGQLVVRSEAGHGTIVRASIPYTNLAAVPGMSNGPLEDIDQTPSVEEQETSDRGGFFARLFGR